MDQPMEKIKMPTCKYDGKGDPRRYIISYEGHMILYTNLDVVWCKVFPTTLTGAATDWFNNQGNGIVDSFEKLTDMFVGQYISNSVRQRTSEELMVVGQKTDKSLRDYIRRFNNEENTIPKLQQEIAVMGLMNGLNDSEFKRYLTRKNLPKLAAAFNKAHDYIKSEELMKTSSWVALADRILYSSEGAASGNGRPKTLAPMRGGGSRQEVRGAKAPMRYSTHTLLNTPKAAIYSVNQNKESWVRLVSMKAKGRDVKKYCMFHWDVRHYTKECTQMKDNIEELIRMGHWTQYRLHTRGNQPPLYRQMERQKLEVGPERPQAGISRQGNNGLPPLSIGKKINVIIGGPVHGRTISRARKHLSKHRHIVNALDADNRPWPASIPDVVFTKEDARGIVFPHDDTLVLITIINGADIKRVLVDAGSLANILFMQAFNEMMIGRQYLTQVSYLVIGFNGSTVRPEGSIVLPVRFGDGPTARDVIAEFLVVDVPSSYNTILGRPIIHDVQAVVSTYNLTMTYVLNLGKVEKVHGGQVMAKYCYVTALKNPVQEGLVINNLKRDRELSVRDLSMENFDTRLITVPRPSPGGEMVKLELQPGDPDQTVKVGADMDMDMRYNLISLLRENADVFAFSADEMPGI